MGTIQHSNTPVLNYSLFEDEFEDDVPGESGPRFNIDTQGFRFAVNPTRIWIIGY
jgi:hypothetical protein